MARARRGARRRRRGGGCVKRKSDRSSRDAPGLSGVPSRTRRLGRRRGRARARREAASDRDEGRTRVERRSRVFKGASVRDRRRVRRRKSVARVSVGVRKTRPRRARRFRINPPRRGVGGSRWTAGRSRWRWSGPRAGMSASDARRSGSGPRRCSGKRGKRRSAGRVDHLLSTFVFFGIARFEYVWNVLNCFGSCARGSQICRARTICLTPGRAPAQAQAPARPAPRLRPAR